MARGSPEEELPQIFDRFYRGADIRHRPGSGLGLAIVHQIAVVHGWEVSAVNEPGGESVSRIELVLEPPAPVELGGFRVCGSFARRR